MIEKKVKDEKAQEKRRERRERIQLSEEFQENPLKKHLKATETGEALRRMFVTGELIDNTQRFSYSDAEKEQTKKKMEEMASKILKMTSNISTEAIKKVSETADPVPEISEQPDTQTAPELENTLQTPIEADAAPVPMPAARKKKPWER